MEEDDHTELTISCNDFILFTEYAIKSSDTDLNDFGNEDEGCQNQFASASGNTNACIDHLGNTPTYYYDPAASSEFTTPDIISIALSEANTDGECNSSTRTGELFTVTDNVVEVEITPNPATTELSIGLTGVEGEYDINVYNMLGEMVLKMTSTTQTTLDVSTLETGHFIIVIENERVYGVTKFIKE